MIYDQDIDRNLWLEITKLTRICFRWRYKELCSIILIMDRTFEYVYICVSEILLPFLLETFKNINLSSMNDSRVDPTPQIR